MYYKFQVYRFGTNSIHLIIICFFFLVLFKYYNPINGGNNYGLIQGYKMLAHVLLKPKEVNLANYNS